MVFLYTLIPNELEVLLLCRGKKAKETTQEGSLSTEPESETARNLKRTKINMLKGLMEKEVSMNKRRILGDS